MVTLDGLSLFMVELQDVDALTLLRLFRNLRFCICNFAFWGFGFWGMGASGTDYLDPKRM